MVIDEFLNKRSENDKRKYKQLFLSPRFGGTRTMNMHKRWVA